MLTDSQSPLTCPDSPVPEGVHPQSLMLSPTPKTLTKDMDPFTVDKNIAHPHPQTTTSSASVFWLTMVVLFGQNPAPYRRDTCYHLQLCSHVWNNYQPDGPYVCLFLAGQDLQPTLQVQLIDLLRVGRNTIQLKSKIFQLWRCHGDRNRHRTQRIVLTNLSKRFAFLRFHPFALFNISHPPSSIGTTLGGSLLKLYIGLIRTWNHI